MVEPGHRTRANHRPGPILRIPLDGADYLIDAPPATRLSVEDDMAWGEWVKPEYPREIINQAGRALIDPSSSSEDTEYALSVINNWRSSHSYPLNTFQIGLRERAKKADPNGPIVAQRLKRLSSISAKLQRFPDMKLSQMQDIAGCRAIVHSVHEVDKLVTLYKQCDIKHVRAHEDDYIRQPKQSGYRGIHLIYRYYSDKKSRSWNDLKVEVQLRSQPQHAWATAVETVGTFIQQALKSSQGEEGWLRFFALMGTAIALREHTPPVPNTPTIKKELKDELQHYVQQLDVEGHLQIYAAALDAPEQVNIGDAHYFLLELDPAARRIRVTGYRADELDTASSEYLSAERDALSGPTGRDAVLVSVDSLSALKRAYPNYFLDTHRFIQAVRQEVGRQKRTERTKQQELFPAR